MPTDPNDEQAGLVGEDALIAEFWAPLAEGYRGALGLKDDCAIVAVPAGEELVVTTDGLIQGVHFFADEHPGAVAFKALAVNVSDLVGKGARPLAYTMSVALPAFDRQWLKAFAAGLMEAQQAFGCHLAGGDTDRTPGPLSVSITAFGAVPVGRFVRRDTARPGDEIYVTGTIGDATLGLRLRRDPELAARCGLSPAQTDYLGGRFSQPPPRVEMIDAVRDCASASMDVSDGLMKDLDRLCRSSGVGGCVETALLPLSDAARTIVMAGEATLEDLMIGGEDYEILAAVEPQKSAEFERRASAAGVRATRIGAITAGPVGARAIGANGAAIAFTKLGWDHFSQR
jgi:thiamine-monophosphate kinase